MLLHAGRDDEIIKELLLQLQILTARLEGKRVETFYELKRNNPRRQHVFKKPLNLSIANAKLLNSWEMELKSYNQVMYDSDNSEDMVVKYENKIEEKQTTQNRLINNSITFSHVLEVVSSATKTARKSTLLLSEIEKICLYVMRNLESYEDEKTHTCVIRDLDTSAISTKHAYKTMFILNEIGFKITIRIDHSVDITPLLVLQIENPHDMLHIICERVQTKELLKSVKNVSEKPVSFDATLRGAHFLYPQPLRLDRISATNIFYNPMSRSLLEQVQEACAFWMTNTCNDPKGLLAFSINLLSGCINGLGMEYEKIPIKQSSYKNSKAHEFAGLLKCVKSNKTATLYKVHKSVSFETMIQSCIFNLILASVRFGNDTANETLPKCVYDKNSMHWFTIVDGVYNTVVTKNWLYLLFCNKKTTRCVIGF